MSDRPDESRSRNIKALAFFQRFHVLAKTFTRVDISEYEIQQKLKEPNDSIGDCWMVKDISGYEIQQSSRSPTTHSAIAGWSRLDG